jgi:hypothetical protein
MDAFPPGLLNGVGVVSLCVFVTWLVLSGRLVSRKTHQDALDALATKDKQIAEKDVQLRYLGEVGQAMNAVLRAVQRGATEDREVREP